VASIDELAFQYFFGATGATGHEPSKIDGLLVFAEIGRQLGVAIADMGEIYATRAALYADLSPAAPAKAWVIGDPVPTYNGIYAKVGASGAGSWTRAAPLPYSVIFATDAGAGTSSTIHATAATVAVTTEALIVVALASTNAASPMFVSFDAGVTSYRIRSAAGTDIAAGGLVGPGMMIGRIDGANFRLVSDQASASIQAAAAASAAAASASATSAALSETNAASYAATALAASVGVTAPGKVTAFVATRCHVATAGNTTYMQMNSRIRHQMRDAVTSVQLLYGNWYVADNGTETAGPGTITVSAALEYPEGTFTQVKWSGATSVTIAPGQNAPLSDPVDLPAGDGAWFVERTWQQAPSGGIIFQQHKHSMGGDLSEYAASGLADKTLTGTITDNSTSVACYGAIAIVGLTAKRAALIVGDSRNAAGASTVHFDADSNKGNYGHAVGAHMGYCIGAKSGQQIQHVISSHSRLVALAAYATDVLIQEGINDLSAGATGATVVSRLQTLIGYFTGKKIWVATIEPYSSSTDGWTTVSGQTAAGWDAHRVYYNNAVRAGIAGVEGYFEFADVVESARDSGKWRIFKTGVAPTGDGVHLSDNGHEPVDRIGPIDVRRIVGYPEETRRRARRQDWDEGLGGGLILHANSVNRAWRKAVRATDQSVPLATATTVTWETITGGGGGRIDASGNRLYLPKGRYRINCQVGILTPTGGQQCFLRGFLSDVKVVETIVIPGASATVTSSFSHDLIFDGLLDNFRVAVTNFGAVTSISGDPTLTFLHISPI
jgi:hypothetical protein